MPRTGGGYGPKSVTTVTTGEGPPSSPPIALKLNSTSAYDINVTWRPPPNDTLNGILRNFTVEWRLNGGIHLGTKNLSGSERYHWLANLEPFTEYDVRIAAVTVAVGPFSNWSTVRTSEAGKECVCITATMWNLCHFLSRVGSNVLYKCVTFYSKYWMQFFVLVCVCKHNM